MRSTQDSNNAERLAEANQILPNSHPSMQRMIYELVRVDTRDLERQSQSQYLPEDSDNAFVVDLSQPHSNHANGEYFNRVSMNNLREQDNPNSSGSCISSATQNQSNKEGYEDSDEDEEPDEDFDNQYFLPDTKQESTAFNLLHFDGEDSSFLSKAQCLEIAHGSMDRIKLLRIMNQPFGIPSIKIFLTSSKKQQLYELKLSNTQLDSEDIK